VAGNEIGKIRDAFLKSGICVQAFIHEGKLVMDPQDIMHCWISEEDHIFSVRLFEMESRLIKAGTDARGRVTIASGFYVWRMPMDKKILALIEGLEQ
jgi:hypothetical protein